MRRSFCEVANKIFNGKPTKYVSKCHYPRAVWFFRTLPRWEQKVFLGRDPSRTVLQPDKEISLVEGLRDMAKAILSPSLFQLETTQQDRLLSKILLKLFHGQKTLTRAWVKWCVASKKLVEALLAKFVCFYWGTGVQYIHPDLQVKMFFPYLQFNFSKVFRFRKFKARPRFKMMSERTFLSGGICKVNSFLRRAFRGKTFLSAFFLSSFKRMMPCLWLLCRSTAEKTLPEFAFW